MLLIGTEAPGETCAQGHLCGPDGAGLVTRHPLTAGGPSWRAEAGRLLATGPVDIEELSPALAPEARGSLPSRSVLAPTLCCPSTGPSFLPLIPGSSASAPSSRPLGHSSAPGLEAGRLSYLSPSWSGPDRAAWRRGVRLGCTKEGPREGGRWWGWNEAEWPRRWSAPGPGVPDVGLQCFLDAPLPVPGPMMDNQQVLMNKK